jgi:hypothetical protein
MRDVERCLDCEFVSAAKADCRNDCHGRVHLRIAVSASLSDKHPAKEGEIVGEFHTSFKKHLLNKSARGILSI